MILPVNDQLKSLFLGALTMIATKVNGRQDTHGSMIGSSGKAASPLTFWWLFVLVHGFEEPLAAGGAQQTANFNAQFSLLHGQCQSRTP